MSKYEERVRQRAEEFLKAAFRTASGYAEKETVESVYRIARLSVQREAEAFEAAYTFNEDTTDINLIKSMEMHQRERGLIPPQTQTT